MRREGGELVEETVVWVCMAKTAKLSGAMFSVTVCPQIPRSLLNLHSASFDWLWLLVILVPCSPFLSDMIGRTDCSDQPALSQLKHHTGHHLLSLVSVSISRRRNLSFDSEARSLNDEGNAGLLKVLFTIPRSTIWRLFCEWLKDEFKVIIDTVMIAFVQFRISY